MNRIALAAFALLSFSLVACAGEATADDLQGEPDTTEATKVDVQPETDGITPQAVRDKEKGKRKQDSAQQEFLIIKMQDVLVSGA
jgi:hypothetical protein